MLYFAVGVLSCHGKKDFWRDEKSVGKKEPNDLVSWKEKLDFSSIAVTI